MTERFIPSASNASPGTSRCAGEPRVVGSADMSSRDIDGTIRPPSEDACFELAKQLAFERGVLRGTLGCNTQRLNTIDESFAELVHSLNAKGEIRSSEIRQAIRAQYDRGQFVALEGEIRNRANKLGLMQGRELDEKGIETTSQDLHSMLTGHANSNPALYSRFPDLAETAKRFACEVELQAIERLHKAEKEAIGISASMRQFWPDFNTFISILAHQTPESLPHLDAAMRARYGVSILEDVQNVCARPLLGLFYPSELILRRTQHLLDGNSSAAVADGIALIVNARWGNKFSALKEILQGVNPSEISQIKSEFDTTYAGRFGEFSALASQFKGTQREVIEPLLAGNICAADAIELHSLMPGGRGSQVRAMGLLEEYHPNELSELQHSYSGRYEVSLSQTIERVVQNELVRERMLAWLSGNTEEHRLISLRCAFAHLDKKTVAEHFLTLDAAERNELITRYEARYGVSFEEELHTKLVRREFLLFKSKREYHMVRSVIANGFLPDEEAIYQCVDGAGTDVQGIKEVLRHLRGPEILALGERYTELMRRRHNKSESMIRRLHAETSGDDRHDIQQYELGWPTNAQGWLKRAIATHGHERSGMFRKIDLITREGPIMDRDVARLREYFTKCESKGRLTPREEMHIEFLGRTALRNFSAFRRSKNALAVQVANLAAAAGSLSVLVGTARAGIPLHGNLPEIGAMVICASALMRYAVNKTLKGHGYAGEEMARDVVFGMVDGLAPVLAKFSPIGALRRALNLGAKIGGKTAVLRVNQALHCSRIRTSGNSAQELERILALADGMAEESATDLTKQDSRTGADNCGVGQLDYPFEYTLSKLASR